MNTNRSLFGSAVFCFLIALIICLPSLNAAPFLDTLHWQTDFQTLRASAPMTRYLSYLTLSWQSEISQIRISNIFIHIMNCLLAIELIRDPRQQFHYRELPLLLLLSCHPSALAVANYGIQRCELLVTFFVFLALNRCKIGQRSRGDLIVIFLLGALACFCKESALVFPILILGYLQLQECDSFLLVISLNFMKRCWKSLSCW